MNDLFNNPEQEQSARECLLKHYSSVCIADGTYVLTVGIAIFAFFEFFPDLTFPNEMLKILTFGFVLGALFTVGTLFVGRLFFWGYLTVIILWIKPANNKEVAKDRESVLDKMNINPLIRLDFACSEYVKNKHKIWSKFVGARLKLYVFIFFSYSLLFGFLQWILSSFA